MDAIAKGRLGEEEEEENIPSEVVKKAKRLENEKN